MSKMYDNPTAHAYREFDKRKKILTERHAPLREKQAKEKTDLEAKHHAEGKKHRHDFREIDYPSRPEGIEQKEAKARGDMEKRHKAERIALANKHGRELAAAKSRIS